MKKDLSELSTELTAISMIVAGLSLQLDAKNEQLTTEAMQDALYGVERYLNRIANDLDKMTLKGDLVV